MNKRVNDKRVIAMAFSIILSWPVSAFSLQQPESQSQSQSVSPELPHGDGWRLVRSIQLGNSKD